MAAGCSRARAVSKDSSSPSWTTEAPAWAFFFEATRLLQGAACVEGRWTTACWAVFRWPRPLSLSVGTRRADAAAFAAASGASSHSMSSFVNERGCRRRCARGAGRNSAPCPTASPLSEERVVLLGTSSEVRPPVGQSYCAAP